MRKLDVLVVAVAIVAGCSMSPTIADDDDDGPPPDDGGLPPFPEGPANIFRGLIVEFDFVEQDCGVLPDGHGRCNVSGALAEGPGFEIVGDWLFGTYGTMFVRFHHGHYGQPIRSHGPNVQMPAPDGAAHHYKITFDLRGYVLERDGQKLREFWADSSTTDVIGDAAIAIRPEWAARLANLTATPFDVARPTVEYAWEGAIGNTSEVASGTGVWGAFHAMHDLTFFVADDGHEYGIAHFGYNENRPELARFDVNAPNRVLLKFGRAHDIFTPAAGLLPKDLAVVDGVLLVRREGGQIDRYDPMTGDYLGVAPTFPDRQVPNEHCDAHGGTVACPDFERNTYVIGDATLGTPGGYVDPVVTDPSNPGDPAVYPGDGNPPRLRFSHYIDDEGRRVPTAFVAFQHDGRFWVSDAATSRVMRFRPDLTPDGTVIQFVPHNYTITVDKNDPRRVFARFLEFEVDYTKPIDHGQGWRLVRNWRLDDLDPTLIGFGDGLHSVVTVVNGNTGPDGLLDGHTYAMASYQHGPWRQIVELAPTGLLSMPFTNLHPFSRIEPDGATILPERDDATGRTVIWRDDRRSPRTALGSIPTGAGAPIASVTYAGVVPAELARDGVAKLISWDQDKSGARHVGAFPLGQDASSWSWTDMPEGPLDGGPRFDPNCEYGGAEMALLGRHAFLIYKGEFWNKDSAMSPNPQGVGQANQIFHFDADGRFLGVMGVPGVFGSPDSPAASAGNMFTIEAVTVGGEIFLYTNNEVGRGVERWRLKFNDATTR